MNYTRDIKVYIEGLVGVLRQLDIEQINRFFTVLQQAKREDRTIYVFGNGGSASTATHMVCDFNKGLSYGKKHRFRMISLNDNVPILLAYANDVNFADIFVEQLRNFLMPEDLVIGISGSGNSENVIRAIDYANSVGAHSIGICGFTGGRLKEKAKMLVHVNINDMQKSEDVFTILTHMAYQVLAMD